MSEIFDFLNKTASEDKKKAATAKPAAERPATESIEPASHAPRPAQSVIEKPVPTEVEVCDVGRFDLTQASIKIKRVLDPLTIVGEQFRLLRSKLGLMQKRRGIKTVLVTSALPQEGKTFSASSIAGVFAQEPGKRVLLIDADMRKPQSGWDLGLNGSGGNVGLSDVLGGNVPFERGVLTAMNPEFCFLPSGALPSNPSELLSSPKLEQLLKAAGENFDWIFIDSPPVISLADTTLLAALCDTTILVVRANSTPSKLVEDAVNSIGRDHICGVILNRQKQINSSRYYYKYYYRKSKSQ